MRVDPQTRRATTEPQQFRLQPDGRLTILSKDEWITKPQIKQVGLWRVG
jgi:hypothetical protein